MIVVFPSCLQASYICELQALGTGCAAPRIGDCVASAEGLPNTPILTPSARHPRAHMLGRRLFAIVNGHPPSPTGSGTPASPVRDPRTFGASFMRFPDLKLLSLSIPPVFFLVQAT